MKIYTVLQTSCPLLIHSFHYDVSEIRIISNKILPFIQGNCSSPRNYAQSISKPKPLLHNRRDLSLLLRSTNICDVKGGRFASQTLFKERPAIASNIYPKSTGGWCAFVRSSTVSINIVGLNPRCRKIYVISASWTRHRHIVLYARQISAEPKVFIKK